MCSETSREARHTRAAGERARREAAAAQCASAPVAVPPCACRSPKRRHRPPSWGRSAWGAPRDRSLSLPRSWHSRSCPARSDGKHPPVRPAHSMCPKSPTARPALPPRLLRARTPSSPFPPPPSRARSRPPTPAPEKGPTPPGPSRANNTRAAPSTPGRPVRPRPVAASAASAPRTERALRRRLYRVSSQSSAASFVAMISATMRPYRPSAEPNDQISTMPMYSFGWRQES